MAKKTNFTLYFNNAKQVNMLSDEQAGRLIKAIYKFAETGEETEFGDLALKIVFSLLADNISLDNEKYDRICHKRSESAKKRWQKQKNKNKNKNKSKDEAAEEDNSNAYDSKTADTINANECISMPDYANDANALNVMQDDTDNTNAYGSTTAVTANANVYSGTTDNKAAANTYSDTVSYENNANIYLSTPDYANDANALNVMQDDTDNTNEYKSMQTDTSECKCIQDNSSESDTDNVTEKDNAVYFTDQIKSLAIQDFIYKFKNICISFDVPEKLTSQDIENINYILSEYKEDEIIHVLRKTERSLHLKGKRMGPKVDFSWIIINENFINIYFCKYDNKFT